MPISNYQQISDVLHVIQQTQPQSILDIGVGFGKWGVLCREVLDISKVGINPNNWQTRIEGIEIFENYENPLWHCVYSQIHIGDALDITPKLDKFDLIIACDVIEHFNKPIGLNFLKLLLSKGNIVVVTSPQGYMPQGIVWGNEYEQHKSSWSENDFQAWPHIYKNIGYSFMAVCSHDKECIDKINVPMPIDILGVKKGALELTKLVVRKIKERSRKQIKAK